MLKKITYINLLIFVGLSLSVFAQDKTIFNDASAKKMLVGKHLLSLQWISWDYFGAANVTNKGGVLYLKGVQKERHGTDFVKIDGTITSIDKKEFKFEGTIVTQISYINAGKPCTRSGEMTFAVTGKRKFWRLQEMTNPCDVAVDYVDIYFRKK